MSRGSAMIPPGLESLAPTVRKTKQPAVGVPPLSGFRDSLPSRHGRAARLCAPKFTASELDSNMSYGGVVARRRSGGEDLPAARYLQMARSIIEPLHIPVGGGLLT